MKRAFLRLPAATCFRFPAAGTFFRFPAAASCMLALAACSAGEPGLDTGLGGRIASRADALAESSRVMRSGGVLDDERPYVRGNTNRVDDQFAPDHGRPFPARIERPGALELSTPEPVSLRRMELLLQELTGFEVVARTRYRAGGESLDFPVEEKARVDHKGPLSRLVRTVAARFDLAWRFDGETIFFDSMETRSYDMPLPSANGALSTTLSGVNVAGNRVSSTRNVELDQWKELAAALEPTLGPRGRIALSPNAGQVAIFAPASAQAEAAKILRAFSALYSRRIGLEIATFYVDAERSSELAADLGLSVDRGGISASLGQGLATALQGGMGVISGGGASASFNLRSLAGSRALADYQMSNTVAQNGVIAPVALANSRKYVSGISRGDGDTAATVRSDEISSGISIYALPRLMRNGRIHLSVWLTQSELNGLTIFDTGNGFVQLPDADQRALEYTLIMEPGETLVMGGYEKERAFTGQRGGLGGLGALGFRKSRENETRRSRMVIMVRPSIIG